MFLAAALALTGAGWAGSRYMYAKWAGVPPVPSHRGAVMMTLGDSEFSYRYGAITLQNLGDYGAETTPLKDYNYKKLGKWFWLLDGLDPASNHVPMLAAYYFGGVTTPKDVAIVVKYLASVGQIPVGNKWRWLAQAIFLAQHRMNDTSLALDLAYKLSKMKPVGDTLPGWARQMPAFVLKARGDHAAGRRIMEDILLSARYLHPNEVNFMKDYLITQLDTDPREVERVLHERQRRGFDKLKPVETPHMPVPMPN
ncbi:MAG: hypothetical protein GC185_09670 [Alphaproteobacteria bacterium]|nr:hypothetical protein [Alphaproteobacteria bacterium]